MVIWVEKEKKKISKRKKIILISTVVTLLILTILFIFLYINYKNNETIKDINNHYSKNVVVTKKSDIYDKNNNKVGKINKGFVLELDKSKINNSKDVNFKIKNTNYYIYYKNVTKNKKENDKFVNKYLVFNKNIKTSKKSIFFIDGKKVLEINKGVNLPIQYMDDNYYYVVYLDRLLQIKKDSGKVIDSINDNSAQSEYVSVINYNEIGDCSNKYCVSLDSVRSQFNHLKDNGFYSIDLEEYKNWLDGKLRLKEKAILLTSNTMNDNFNTINNEFSLKIQLLSDNNTFKFNDVNKKSTVPSSDGINRYIIKKTTSLESFKKMTNGEDVLDPDPAPKNSQQKIAVINYHFFYDSSLGEACNESICLDVKNFRQQLDYLKNNGYKTLKMSEFKQWMYGEIELPEKSVLLTIDDGAFGTGAHNGNKLIPILEEYNMNATLFLITGWWGADNYRSKNLDIQSHTNDMHQYGTCGKGQMVCYSYNQVMEDLAKSLTVVDNNDSFCFPFYSYSDEAIRAVKDSGFKIAFVGGNRKASRSDNKFKIPRYPIYKNTSLNQFINMVN